MQSEPFALNLYRRFLEGETVQQLAAGLSIPEERVAQRIRAAASFYERQKTRGGLIVLGEQLDRAGRDE
jgi:hypothetical protein